MAVAVEVGSDAQVIEPGLLRPGVEETRPCHAAQPPKVLVLAVGAIAPAKDLESNQIALAWAHIGCDIEFGGQERISKKYVYYAKQDAKRGLGFEIYVPCRTAIVFQRKKN